MKWISGAGERGSALLYVVHTQMWFAFRVRIGDAYARLSKVQTERKTTVQSAN